MTSLAIALPTVAFPLAGAEDPGPDQPPTSTEREPAQSSPVQSGNVVSSTVVQSAPDWEELSDAALTEYLSSLSRLGGPVTLWVQHGNAASARPLTKISELHRLLLEKQVGGARVQYMKEGVAWVDTLRVQQKGTLRSSQPLG